MFEDVAIGSVVYQLISLFLLASVVFFFIFIISSTIKNNKRLARIESKLKDIESTRNKKQSNK
ncbi:hypothetical protein BTS2_2021 [Bacillus sp. TS-2]|nr:hypothetical protein BTS2_2021 [Bacillus sp. TS-2]